MKIKHTLTMAAAVLALAACSPQPSYDNDWQMDKPARVCKDNRGIRVPDSQCQQRTGSGSSAFMWFYMGRNSYIPPVGSAFGPGTVGSNRPAPNTKYFVPTAKAPSYAVTRGGFGSSAHSSVSS